MLFYEYFQKHIDKQICITLKNEMQFTGILKSVDLFLNLRIDLKEELRIPELEDVSTISFRGSAIKYVDLDFEDEIDSRLNQATLLGLALINN